MRRNACAGTLGTPALLYQFKGAKLTSQSFTSNIGDNASISSTYEVQIGGPQQTDRGIFISGSYPA
jgi:hypothetical protein